MKQARLGTEEERDPGGVGCGWDVGGVGSETWNGKLGGGGKMWGGVGWGGVERGERRWGRVVIKGYNKASIFALSSRQYVQNITAYCKRCDM